MAMLLVVLAVVVLVVVWTVVWTVVAVCRLAGRMKIYENDLGDILEIYGDIHKLNEDIKRLDGWIADTQETLDGHTSHVIYNDAIEDINKINECLDGLYVQVANMQKASANPVKGLNMTVFPIKTLVTKNVKRGKK